MLINAKCLFLISRVLKKARASARGISPDPQAEASMDPTLSEQTTVEDVKFPIRDESVACVSYPKTCYRLVADQFVSVATDEKEYKLDKELLIQIYLQLFTGLYQLQVSLQLLLSLY